MANDVQINFPLITLREWRWGEARSDKASRGKMRRKEEVTFSRENTSFECAMRTLIDVQWLGLTCALRISSGRCASMIRDKNVTWMALWRDVWTVPGHISLLVDRSRQQGDCGNICKFFRIFEKVSICFFKFRKTALVEINHKFALRSFLMKFRILSLPTHGSVYIAIEMDPLQFFGKSINSANQQDHTPRS